MPYVRRDATGEIESVHRAAGRDAMEYMDGSAPEICRFFEQSAAVPSVADAHLTLVVDSAIDVLVAKGVLSIEELSPDARAAWVLHKELKGRQERDHYTASGFVEIIDDSKFGSLGG